MCSTQAASGKWKSSFNLNRDLFVSRVLHKCGSEPESQDNSARTGSEFHECILFFQLFLVLEAGRCAVTMIDALIVGLIGKNSGTL